MKETFITLGLVKRFDEKWEVVEKPTEDEMHAYEAHEDDDIEYGMSKEMIAHGSLKRCKAYNNAKEYAYYPTMVEFTLWMSKQWLSDWGTSFDEYLINYAGVMVQPLTLDQFIPAVEVDGVWKVLSEPQRIDYKDIDGYYDEHHWTINTVQYQKALDKVKYEGWEYSRYIGRHIAISHNDVKIIFYTSGHIELWKNSAMLSEASTTEHLINELSKHGVCLILNLVSVSFLSVGSK